MKNRIVSFLLAAFIGVTGLPPGTMQELVQPNELKPSPDIQVVASQEAGDPEAGLLEGDSSGELPAPGAAVVQCQGRK